MLKIGRSDSGLDNFGVPVSQTNPRNGTDFEILTDSFDYGFESHSYPHIFLLFVAEATACNYQCGIGCVKAGTFAVLEGPRCSLMPVLHNSGIETQTVSKYKLLGLKPS